MTDSNDPKPQSDIRRISARDRKQKLGKTRLEFGPLSPRDALPPPDLPENMEEQVDTSDAFLEVEASVAPDIAEVSGEETPVTDVAESPPAPEPALELPETVDDVDETEQEEPPDEGDPAPEMVIPFEFEYPPEWRGKTPPAAEPKSLINAGVLANAETSAEAVEPVEEIELEAGAFDPEMDALLDQIEEDTAAMRAITAEEERRAAKNAGRYPPLPAEANYTARKNMTPPPPRKRRRSWPYNLLTFLFIVGGCGLLYVFITLWSDPFSALNPLPPLTPIPIVVSQTPTPSLTPVPSDTPTPTLTFTPSETPEPSLTPSETPIPGTPTPFYAFTVPLTLGSRQVYITNPQQRGGCQWSSIAGSVADANGSALNNYQIRILGEGVDETLISGTATGYGPGGFELPLGFEARDAQFAVQLLDPGGMPVSDVYTITTSSRCDWNISVVRFTQQAAPQ